MPDKARLEEILPKQYLSDDISTVNRNGKLKVARLYCNKLGDPPHNRDLVSFLELSKSSRRLSSADSHHGNQRTPARYEVLDC